MKIDIIKNAKKNIVFGLLNKIIVLICPFVVRAVIKMNLGADYLGLSSLFTSILTVLSLSELGFSSAIVYKMYKPIAENNICEVNALLYFYKKIYRIIGVIILFFGLMVIPFLPQLIKGNYPNDIRLVYLYLIFLFDAVISYFMFGYLNSLVVAYQRDDINSICNTVVKLLLTTFQIIAVVKTKNYYLYAVLIPLFTIINNIWIAIAVKKSFPQYRCEGKIPDDDLRDIKIQTAGAFTQRLCAVTRNSLDSICISTFLGLTLTAIYDNYFVILKSVSGMLLVVSSSLIGGIGNHVITKSKDDNFKELKKIDSVYLMLSGWCLTCLLCLYQPFMCLWMGNTMTLPYFSVVLFGIYFYLLTLGDMRSMYTAVNGLWWEQRYRAITETILNLVLNIFLGKFFGINGIIIATGISLFLCDYVWGAKITFDKYFTKQYLSEYYKYQLKNTLVNLSVCTLTVIVCFFAPEYDNIIINIFLRLMICLIIPGVSFYCIYKDKLEIQTLIASIKKY